MNERPDTYKPVFLSKIGIVPEPKSRCIHNIRGDRRDAKADSDESAMAHQSLLQIPLVKSHLSQQMKIELELDVQVGLHA